MFDSPPPAAPSSSERPWFVGAAAVLLGTVAWLRLSGRRWWCACGSPVPWALSSQSRHTSQHVLDPYSFTHVLHGFAFYALLALVLRRLGPRARLALAVAIEAGWEILENSPAVIARYRQETIALDYTGDSIANSLGDIACCALGFSLAQRLPTRVSVLLVVAIELALLATIRDNLTLNIVMLLVPLESVKAWQRGG